MPTYTAMIEMVPFTIKVDAKDTKEAKEKVEHIIKNELDDRILSLLADCLYFTSVEKD